MKTLSRVVSVLFCAYNIFSLTSLFSGLKEIGFTAGSNSSVESSVFSSSTTTSSVVGTPQQQAYLVDNNGYIDFPVLGKILVKGKSREEVISILKSKLAPDYVKDPTINIRIINFRITIYGDVLRPGTFTVDNERLSILDALGLAGDLNISARRDNIMILREEEGQKIEYRINLLSKKTLTSPAFYLKQNDIIYVEHNSARIQDAAYTRSTGLFISLASVLISLLTILR